MILTGFSLGCIATIFLSVLRDFRQLLVGKLFLAMLVAASAFLIHDSLPVAWRWLAGDVMTTLPALFWGICILGFAASPAKHKGLLPVALFSFIAPAIGRPFGAEDPANTLLHHMVWQTAQYCEYVVICAGVYAVVSGWKGDLIEGRRKLRAYILCVLGLTALVVTVSLNFGIGKELPLVVVAVCCLMCSYLMLFTRKEALVRAVSSYELDTTTALPAPGLRLVAPVEEIDEQSVLAESLCGLMETGFYRNENLSLRLLARRLDVPEYRLRKVINERFNYRNFNDYINQLRIEEASIMLARDAATPVQNIAIDVGYRTMSSFNRAFKDIQRCTPTQFRSRKSHDEGAIGDDQVHTSETKK